jgi:hypothetical protein
MNARETLLEKVSGSSDQRARFFESALFRNLMREFLLNVGEILSRRLERKTALVHTGDTSSIVDSENMLILLFRVYQSNIEIALPFECVNEFLSGLLGREHVPDFSALTQEDIETVQQFITRVLMEEERFSRHRVLLRGISAWTAEDRAERLRSSEEIFLALQTGSVSYLLRAYCDVGLISRLRTYGQLSAGNLIRHFPFRTKWKLRASCALNSYQLLLSIVPGERISLKELFRERFQLEQDANGLARCVVELGGDVKFSKKVEVKHE